MLDQNKKWTKELAAAVNDDRANLLDTIQLLRRRATDNGILQGGREQQVERYDRAIVIKPADNRRLALPYYDPAQVFVAAGNSALPAQYWAAQAITPPQNRSPGGGIAFGLATPLPDRAFYDAEIDWRRAELLVRRTDIGADSIAAGARIWHHDPAYRTHGSASAAAGGNIANGDNGERIDSESAPPSGSVSTATTGNRGASRAGTGGNVGSVGTDGTAGGGQQTGTRPLRPQR